MPVTTSQERFTRRIGKSMVAVAWIIGLVLLTLFFNRYLDGQRNPNQDVHGSVDAAGVRVVALQRNRAGHYVAAGTINENPVEFLIDTGATDVSVPDQLANRLGLKRGRAVPYHTANGIVNAYQTEIKELTLGTIRLTNVRASINPGAQGMGILMGMSVLRSIEFTQKDGLLILRQAPANDYES